MKYGSSQEIHSKRTSARTKVDCGQVICEEEEVRRNGSSSLLCYCRVMANRRRGYHISQNVHDQ